MANHDYGPAKLGVEALCVESPRQPPGGGKEQRKINKCTDACKRQRTGTLHVQLTTNEENQMKHCLPAYVSDTASFVMTTNYTGKIKLHYIEAILTGIGCMQCTS